MIEKICKSCKQPKFLTEFYKSKSGRLGLSALCKECDKLKTAKWAKEHPEKRKAQRRRAYDKNTDGAKHQYLMYNYGISLIEFNKLLDEQHNLCAVCGRPETAKHKSGKLMKLAVDHDHKTGQVRGLLCYNCNSGIGRFKDDPDRLRRAANYLEKKK